MSVLYIAGETERLVPIKNQETTWGSNMINHDVDSQKDANCDDQRTVLLDHRIVSTRYTIMLVILPSFALPKSYVKRSRPFA